MFFYFHCLYIYILLFERALLVLEVEKGARGDCCLETKMWTSVKQNARYFNRNKLLIISRKLRKYVHQNISYLIWIYSIYN
jgi:hypothetical protein